MRTMACLAALAALLLAASPMALRAALARQGPVMLAAEAEPDAAASKPAAKPPAAKEDDGDDDDDDDSPEGKMEARFPQPVRVGFLVGLPMLDWGDSTIGFIRDVVRTPEDKIELIVGIGGWFGYWPKRDVAVPIEAVAILARQVDALDLSREQIESSPTFDPTKGQPIDRDATIRIALARR